MTCWRVSMQQAPGHTWQAIQGQGYGGIIFNGSGYTSQDEFVDAVVDLALGQFPSAGKIESDLKADYQVGVIFTDMTPMLPPLPATWPTT